MITFKLKLIQSVNIEKYQKQFTNIRNFAFNRFIEGLSQNQIEQQVKTKLNNIELMDVSLQKEAVNDAKTLIKQDQKTVIFGSKKNWENYNKKLISKDEYKKRKFEDYEIVKRLVNIAKHYKCEYFAYEKLSIESGEKGKGKRFNKMCNNDWRRNRPLDISNIYWKLE